MKESLQCALVVNKQEQAISKCKILENALVEEEDNLLNSIMIDKVNHKSLEAEYIKIHKLNYDTEKLSIADLDNIIEKYESSKPKESYYRSESKHYVCKGKIIG